jgi:hypothetical protein
VYTHSKGTLNSFIGLLYLVACNAQCTNNWKTKRHTWVTDQGYTVVPLSCEWYINGVGMDLRGKKKHPKKHISTRSKN